MFILIKFLLAIVLTEALTEVITKSEIFEPLRRNIFKRGQDNKFFNWVHRLLDCGYCFSVWSGAFTAFLLLRDFDIVCFGLDQFILGVVLHRLSNLFHNVIDRIHGV